MGVSTQQKRSEVGVLLLASQPSCQRAIKRKQPVVHLGAHEYWRECTLLQGHALIARES